jgi:hypothetical protein
MGKVLRGVKTHKRLIINQIVERFVVKNGVYTEGSSIYPKIVFHGITNGKTTTQMMKTTAMPFGKG